jgi:hypothetical protein
MGLDEKKKDALFLPYLDEAADHDQLVLSTGNGRMPFDESHDGNTLFWHGTGFTRTAEQVFSQGFNSKWERDDDPNAGKIIWRSSEDDIVLDSAVCLARDIRGSAFFPLTSADDEDTSDAFYIFAVAPAWTTRTFGAQKVAEAVETGQMKGSFAPSDKHFWKDPARWAYDPTEEDAADACCVWQFIEHATLRVVPMEIVGCWLAGRQVLVDPGEDHRQKAGIRFQIQRLVRGNRKHELFEEARSIASNYEKVYPAKGGHWLSYQGIIECRERCRRKADAKLFAKQLKPVVINEFKPNARGSD